MKETKTASASPEARAAMHEMMAAFEAFKGANDARLDEIEKKASADALLEEKVARIDQAVAGAQARLDRALSESRRPILSGSGLGAETSSVVAAPEAKAAWDGYMKSGQAHGLELKAGLSSASNSVGWVGVEPVQAAPLGCGELERMRGRMTEVQAGRDRRRAGEGGESCGGAGGPEAGGGLDRGGVRAG